jgi:ABC-type Fe3+ transport system substrate-binding protein
VPANVGIIKGAPHAGHAKTFIDFLLSDDGQLMLFSKEIARLPVVPTLYATAPAGYPNPFQMKLGGIDFDQELSSARRDIVLSLFD